jgi:cell division protein FtsW (lipid II flippase)
MHGQDARATKHELPQPPNSHLRPRAARHGRIWQRLAIATNWPVLVAVGVLSALGVLCIWEDKTEGKSDGPKQLIFLLIAILCMGLFQAVNYQKIGRFAWGFYLAAMALICYTVLGAALSDGGRNRHPIPGIWWTKGACAWISIGSISLQPAELMKVAFILVLARYLRFRSNYRTVFGLIPPFCVAMVPLILILKQPDLGTALTFLPPLFAMLFVAGAKKRHLLAIVAAGVLLAPLLWFSGKHIIDKGTPQARLCTACPNLPILRHFPQFVKHYQRDRVFAMLDANSQALRDVNYQQDNALAALGSGGIAGKGLGTMPISRHVPERHNDMIFALIGEQFGFFGSAVILAAYLVLFAAGIEISASTREPFGRLVAIGIVALLAGQTFVNLMVALKLMPVTGVTLPFISYGGSSLLASFMAAGLLLNIGQNRPIVMANNSFEFEEE